MLPAIIAASALSELAPWLAKRITKGSFQAASLATGAYAGFLGAGIGIILVAFSAFVTIASLINQSNPTR
jgi:hypothetical protein